jgi:hypothetical protein
MTSLLENKGIAVIGGQNNKKSPVVVIGTARGGTSMIAGTLAKLGVFMGDLADPPVYEDARLSEAIEKGEMLLASEIVKEYDLMHPRWGWKRPSSIHRLDLLDDLFGHPIYIFVFKDIFSIAQRNSISMFEDVLVGMDRALRDYSKMLEYLRKGTSDSMLVSYDKALRDPKYFVGTLVKFCGLAPSSSQVEQAIKFIRPDPTDYLDSTRISKAHGRIDCVKNGVVYGWARLIHLKMPAVVNFYVEDENIGEVIADGVRDDLEKHFDTPCAFEFSLPEYLLSTERLVLRARVANEINDLDNSPFVLES